MDPKLRPSFAEIGKTLEEILSHLQEEELETDRKLLPTAKGKRSDQSVLPDPKGRNQDVGPSSPGLIVGSHVQNVEGQGMMEKVLDQEL